MARPSSVISHLPALQWHCYSRLPVRLVIASPLHLGVEAFATLLTLDKASPVKYKSSTA